MEAVGRTIRKKWDALEAELAQMKERSENSSKDFMLWAKRIAETEAQNKALKADYFNVCKTRDSAILALGESRRECEGLKALRVECQGLDYTTLERDLSTVKAERDALRAEKRSRYMAGMESPGGGWETAKADEKGREEMSSEPRRVWVRYGRTGHPIFVSDNKFYGVAVSSGSPCPLTPFVELTALEAANREIAELRLELENQCHDCAEGKYRE